MENQHTTELIAIEKFGEYLQLKGFASSTREKITKAVVRFAAWCDEQNVPVAGVSYNDVTAYIAHCKAQGNKPRTLQIVVGYIKHYYSFLLDEKLVADNPCTNIEIRGVKRKILYDTFTTGELETIYKTFAGKPITPNGAGSHITHKRNKVILGLIVYQGLRTQELADLDLKSLELKEGKIYVEGSKRTESRSLKLEAHQVYDLMDYVNETRKLILELSGKQSEKLFISTGGGGNFGNVIQKILATLQKQNPRIKEIKQLRGSVITNWLKVHNVRKAQYMAGHRYVSSTESYQANNMDGLREDVNRYHPNL
jgi:integrase/recombinase XerD